MKENLTEEPMVEQLQAHDQLDLLYDMEQPLAAVLAKMEIAGIKVERQTLEACRWKTKWSWSAWPKKFTSLQEKSSTSILQNNWASSSWKIGTPLLNIRRRPNRLFNSRWCLGTPGSNTVSKILEYRQISKIQSTYVIGLQDWIWKMGRSIPAMYRIWRRQALVQRGSQPAKHSCPFGTRPSHYEPLSQKENSVLLSSDYSQIELRVLASSGDEHLIDAFKHGQISIHRLLCEFSILKNQKTWRRTTVAMQKAVNFGVFMEFPTLDCLTT